MSLTKELGDVALSFGWFFWDGVTDWGRNDVFNWAGGFDVGDTVQIGLGSGDFGGISATVSASASKEIRDLFDLDTSKKIKFSAPKLKVGGTIGGAFNIPLN